MLTVHNARPVRQIRSIHHMQGTWFLRAYREEYSKSEFNNFKIPFTAEFECFFHDSLWVPIVNKDVVIS